MAADGVRVRAGGPLRGTLRVPGDKSISHRAILLGAIAEGTTTITGLLEGEDVLATMAAVEAMGVTVERIRPGTVRIPGAGKEGLRAPDAALDLGNSGTGMRLLIGLLAGQDFAATLIGDRSLSKRPMGRVAEPLARMGAVISTGADGTPPVTISPAPGLCGIDYPMPVASAQVKSALLLAGLYAKGVTCVVEPAPTRDHTERMLQGFGYPCEKTGARSCVKGGHRLRATDVDVPADLSSAAFFVVAALTTPGSEIRLDHVGVNPTRTGLLDVLHSMGGEIGFENRREICGEPVADLVVAHRTLRGIEVPPDRVPLAIDEIPILAVAAACAEGDTTIRGAEELRYKESDRLHAMAQGLRALGVVVDEFDDGLRIQGGGIRQGGRISSFGDHRIAMAFAMAAAKGPGTVQIDGWRNVATSFPAFDAAAGHLGVTIERC